MIVRTALIVSICIFSLAPRARAENSSPERGRHLLLNKAYLPPDFDQETFDATWKRWEEPLRSRAAKATPEERRQMAFQRYGLMSRPDDPAKPLQYVVNERGQWSMNCLACHQGKVAGRVVPGAPNSHFALETLTADIRWTKLRLGKKLTRMDTGSLIMPLGSTVGTTNAVMFGVALMNFRDADLNIHPNRPLPEMTHHDHDAPAWWNVRRKGRLYSDNFAPKGHRALMQFLLVKENGPKKFRQWEDDFRHIEAYIESLTAPKYPYPIEQELAAQGRTVFNRNCANCHGTYGPDAHYPEKIVPLDEVATDPVRWESLTAENRRDYLSSWFNHKDPKHGVASPAGYLAPPLDGIWASAPYFHNGSVPTLWHVLHPDSRPVVWRRTEDGYDRSKVGLEVAEFNNVPPAARSKAARRRYFDTRKFGKSATGHEFPKALEHDEKRAVLEYLKTL